MASRFRGLGCPGIFHEVARLSRKQDKNFKEIKDTIQSFRDNASLFTRGMKAKADRIEQALGQVLIEERYNLHISKIPADGTINEAEAASSFKNFKQRLSAVAKTHQLWEIRLA